MRRETSQKSLMWTLTSTIHFKTEKITFIRDVFVHIRFSLDDTVLYLYKYLINRYIFKVFLLHTIALMRVSLFSLKRLYMEEIKEIYF